MVENKVAHVQEASVVVYDYYETCKDSRGRSPASVRVHSFTFDPVRQLGGQRGRTTQTGGRS